MKGKEKVLVELNRLLADELTVINQYMVHAEMCENWGYKKLQADIRKQAMDEMHHAEWLIERLLFLEGTPTVSTLNPMSIGRTVTDIIINDYSAECDVVKSYNEAIRVARSVEDQGTADLFSKILAMEEGHVDWAEAQRSQIEQMGVEQYLSNQTGSA